jgi:hypothetical protein
MKEDVYKLEQCSYATNVGMLISHAFIIAATYHSDEYQYAVD